MPLNEQKSFVMIQAAIAGALNGTTNTLRQEDVEKLQSIIEDEDDPAMCKKNVGLLLAYLLNYCENQGWDGAKIATDPLNIKIRRPR